MTDTCGGCHKVLKDLWEAEGALMYDDPHRKWLLLCHRCLNNVLTYLGTLKEDA